MVVVQNMEMTHEIPGPVNGAWSNETTQATVVSLHGVSEHKQPFDQI